MPQILLVEDDLKVAELLKGALEASGFVVSHTDRMDVALELFEAHKINLVITDFHIKDGSGRRLLHEIRKIHPDVPVFLITGTPYIQEKDLEIYGFEKVFLKPFMPQALAEEAKKVCQ